jgi:fructosamine-3-kinase
MLDRLCARIEDFLPDAPPSLLHGDLWSGNTMSSADDTPVIYDPAVYYGHREVDLAFTELFGGFPARFYEAYQDVFPLEPGYEERKRLYQLYPLLVHMNLFGGGYTAQVDQIAEHYLGG